MPVAAATLEGSVIRLGDYPTVGLVDLEKSTAKSNNKRGLFVKHFFILILSLYALVIITFIGCFVLKGIWAYLSKLKDDYILLQRSRV